MFLTQKINSTAPVSGWFRPVYTTYLKRQIKRDIDAIAKEASIFICINLEDRKKSSAYANDDLLDLYRDFAYYFSKLAAKLEKCKTLEKINKLEPGTIEIRYKEVCTDILKYSAAMNTQPVYTPTPFRDFVAEIPFHGPSQLKPFVVTLEYQGRTLPISEWLKPVNKAYYRDVQKIATNRMNLTISLLNSWINQVQKALN